MSVRRRLTLTLFTGAALGTTGYIAAATVSALVVEDLTGRATLAGLPGAIAILGTALGTSLLSMRVADRGRRPGLVGGYAAGALGATAAVLAVALQSITLLLAGMVILGLGNASNQLARYTGAELFPPDRRASALSLIVWAGTIGSVVGPSLLKPGGVLATDRGVSELAGGYIVALVAMAAAMLVYLLALRPDPASLAVDTWTVSERPRFGDAFSRPHVKVALAALISGQVVMVVIMIATPLHIRHHGFDLGIVGLVMSAHTLGMFALSPITGRVADLIGRYRTILLGLAVLAASAIMAATAPTTSTGVLLVALFLLGLGWNLTFVAGSALLTVGFAPELRARVQGRADSITWVSSALASLSSGIFFEFTDYRIVSLAGLALLAIPLSIVLRNREQTAAVLVS
jgi:MFS family permease